MQLNQKQLLSTSESLRTTLDEQMFWIPSNQPLDLSWFKMTPTLLKNQLTEIPWGSGVRELGEGLVDRPLLFLPLFLLIAALLWKRRYLYDKLAELNDDIGHFKRDSQLHTPLAILITILLALPGTLTFAVAGLALLLTPPSAAPCWKWPRSGCCSTPPIASSPRAASPSGISTGAANRSASSTGTWSASALWSWRWSAW